MPIELMILLLAAIALAVAGVFLTILPPTNLVLPRAISRWIPQADHDTGWQLAIVAGSLAFPMLAAVLYRPAEAAFAGANSPLSERLAFAQVYTGIVAILLVVGLGGIALWLLIASRMKPQLYLELLDEGTTPVDDRSSALARNISLLLVNRGSDVSIWFQGQIRIPFLPPDMGQYFRAYGPIVEVAAKEEHIFVFHSDESTLWLGFLGTGSICAVPGFPLVLCQFRVPEAWFGSSPVPMTYICSYTLASERAKVRQGELRLSLFELAPGAH